MNMGGASWGERQCCRETEAQRKSSDFIHKNYRWLPANQKPGSRWSPLHRPEALQPGVKSSTLVASSEL